MNVELLTELKIPYWTTDDDGFWYVDPVTGRINIAYME